MSVQNVRAEEEVPLCRGVVVWEMAGLVLCMALAFGALWWERASASDDGSPRIAQTVSSADIARCRLRALTGTDAALDTVALGAAAPARDESSRCKSLFVPVPDDVPEGDEFSRRLWGFLDGTPMADLVPFLHEYDRTSVAFAVGIAKKESGWGEHAPRRDGQDCYNYWGYKGRGGNGSVEGYACFASPEEAVDTVVQRISELVNVAKRDTPQKMVVWKCGSSCASDNPANVERWIRDVGLYYRQLAS